MTTLYLAWQDAESRRWFPVGRLNADENVDPTKYEFSYLDGARKACESAAFFEIPGFPEMAESYQSSRLFPFFQNRLMNLRRPDRAEYLRQLGLDVDNWNPLVELTASARYRDNFEMFRAIEPDADGRFTARFALYGLRHTNPDAIRRIESLAVGERLGAVLEPDDEIRVYTQDGCNLGLLPRYLVDTVHQDGAWETPDIKATVAQVNLDGPLSHRLLVDFSGKLRPGFRPMEHLPQYQPIRNVALTYPVNKSSGRNADTV